MELSENGGTPISSILMGFSWDFHGIFHYTPSILGKLHLWKPPYGFTCPWFKRIRGRIKLWYLVEKTHVFFFWTHPPLKTYSQDCPKHPRHPSNHKRPDFLWLNATISAWIHGSSKYPLAIKHGNGKSMKIDVPGSHL